MRTPTVAAIVVSYGPQYRAEECAGSLLRGDTKPDYVVIVNNGPSRFDEPRGIVRTVTDDPFNSGFDPSLGPVLIESAENLGYSGGLRLGVAALSASQAEVDYVWLLNNDLTVHPSALSGLLAAASRDASVGLWGATVCTDRGFSSVSAIGVRYSYWTTRRRPALSGMEVAAASALPDEPDYDFIPGSAMFISRDVYERCGGLSPAYFMYFEELDLAARIRSVGYSVRWCRDALVAHEGGATTGSYRTRRLRPPDVGYHATRSAIVYTRRHARAALPTVIMSRLARHAFVSALVGDGRSARATVRGCLDGLRIPLGPGGVS